MLGDSPINFHKSVNMNTVPVGYFGGRRYLSEFWPQLSGAAQPGRENASQPDGATRTFLYIYFIFSMTEHSLSLKYFAWYS